MSNDSERSASQESDLTSGSGGFHQTDINLFDGSFDAVFPTPNFQLFDFLKIAQQSPIYSPQPYVKPIESCRVNQSIVQNKRNTYSTSLEFREVTDRSPNAEEPKNNSFDLRAAAANNLSFIGNYLSNVRSTRLLPSWAVDLQGNIREDLLLSEVIDRGSLVDFAMDRMGVKYLERHYPVGSSAEEQKLLFEKLTEQKTVFTGLCRSASGNFFMQKLVEHANIEQQERLAQVMIASGLVDMCLDKFACRVVQLAVQKFDMTTSAKITADIARSDILSLCTDQCAIHVLQKIVKIMPIASWSFFVKFLCRDDNLMNVCQDKYGCRLVQQTIDKLSDNPKSVCFNARLQLLHALMTCVARNCFRLASNEFANYVVQYVIKSSGIMEMYRDTIIEKCLLRNLLSMSQDKYASHVVEGAFLFAPPHLLSEMMDEIFDGYVKDHETNRDALDILLFHQYGNYVVQQMISLCISALLGKEERKLKAADTRLYAKWFDRIKSRVSRNASRLERFSSGKKIIESLSRFEPPQAFFNPLDENMWTFSPTSLMNLTSSFANRLNIMNNNSVFDD